MAGPSQGLRLCGIQFLMHRSTAISNWELLNSHSVRVIPFPCRRILGGWIKAETKTRIDVCPTHWREWSTDRNAPRSPRDFARYRGA